MTALGRLGRQSRTWALRAQAGGLGGLCLQSSAGLATAAVAAPPVHRRPPHAPAVVGATIQDIETPALIVRVDQVEKNLQRMTTIMERHPSVSLRPHGKSHKTPEIAALQLSRPQTSGLCCQKVSEAMAFAEGGCNDLLLTTALVSPMKARRLVALARRGCRVTAALDSAHAAEVLALAARSEGVRLRVLVDVNVGQNRCGVSTPAEAVEVARAISQYEELHFGGIQAYHGGLQHIRDYYVRKAQAAEVACKASAVAAALEQAGFSCKVITGGGTGTFEFDAASNVFTEVQPGSYIFNDVDYSNILESDGLPTRHWEQSLFVAATVIHRSEAARRIVLDAGMKAVSYDSGPPELFDYSGTSKNTLEVVNGGDEHTIVNFKNGGRLPELGTTLLLTPGHCDPTVNLHDYLVAIRDNTVEAVWPVAGRGAGL